MPGGPELVFILIIVLVLFGGSQLPKLARNLGKAQKEFKDGMSEGGKPDESAGSPSANAKTDSANDSASDPT